MSGPNRAATFLIAIVLAPSIQAQSLQEKVAEAVRRVDAGVAQGPFAAEWSSLEKFQVPQWYLDAKFGIFIHWGVYSVPALRQRVVPAEHVSAEDRTFAHHVETFGPPSRFGYKDFIPMFRAERFDARAWARLFKAAGARYVVPVAEHHDGFPMYDCSFTDWCAAKMGPKRDVVGELAEACAPRGWCSASPPTASSTGGSTATA